jgi:uncharacterized protein YbaR (Trm112 family)
MPGLFKAVTRLALVGGLGVGAALAYRRLTRSGAEQAPSFPRELPRVPLPPQDIHDLLPILACPNCKSSLRLSEDEQQLICDSCRVAYAIEEGIPVLLPDSGKPLA